MTETQPSSGLNTTRGSSFTRAVSNFLGLQRAPTLPIKYFCPSQPSTHEEPTAKDYLTYCQQQFLNDSVFSRDDIPPGFLEISEDIRNDFNDKTVRAAAAAKAAAVAAKAAAIADAKAAAVAAKASIGVDAFIRLNAALLAADADASRRLNAALLAADAATAKADAPIAADHPMMKTVNSLLKIEKKLLQLRKDLHFDQKELALTNRSLGALYTALAYIRQFYQVTINRETGTVVTMRREAMAPDKALDCLKALEKLDSLQHDRTRPQPFDDKKESVAADGAEKSLNTPLSQEYDKLTFGQAMLASDQGKGILLFCLSDVNFADLTNTHIFESKEAQSLFNAGLSTAFIMIGFGTMMASSQSLTYRVNLQKQLLSTLVASLLVTEPNDSPQKLLADTYSSVTCAALNVHLPKDQQILVSTDNAPPKQMTAIDARALVVDLLKGPVTLNTLNDLSATTKTADPQKNKDNASLIADALVNHAIKHADKWGRNSRWGTLLDHLFLRLPDDEKKDFTHWLKHDESLAAQTIRAKLDVALKSVENIEGKENSVILNGNLLKSTNDNGPGLITTAKNLAQATDWGDREVGSTRFSQLVWGMRLNLHLHEDDAKFLLEEVVLKELSAGGRGVFGAAKAKQGRFLKYMAVSTFYAVTMVVISFLLFTFGGGVAPLTLGLVGLFGNAIGASTFGVVGTLMPNVGKSTSFKTKQELVKELQASFEETEQAPFPEHWTVQVPSEYKKLQAENEDKANNKELRELYATFKDQVKDFKSKKTSDAFKKLKDTLTELKKCGVSEFACELGHGEKNSPLFDIIATLQKTEKDAKKRLEQTNDVLDLVYGAQLQGLYKKITEKNTLDYDTITADEFGALFTQTIRAAKGSNGKMFAVLTGAALLAKISEGNNENTTLACTKIFIDAVENAAHTKASELFDLQLRNVNTYGNRRVTMRIMGNIITGTILLLGAMLVAAGTLFTGTWWAGIALAVAGALLAGVDFSTRKFAELLQWSTRLTVGDKVLLKAYRNYELVADIADSYKKHSPQYLNKFSNKPSWSATKVLNSFTASMASAEKSNIEGFADKQRKDFFTGQDPKKPEASLETLLKNFYGTNLDTQIIQNITDAHELQKDGILIAHVKLLLKQGYDKEAAARVVLRVLRLLESAEGVSSATKQILLEDLQTAVRNGSLSNILSQKGYYAAGHYGLADFALGVICGIPNVVFACLGSITQSAMWMEALSLPQQAALKGAVSFTCDGITFVGWVVVVVDVSEKGRTEHYQATDCSITAYRVSYKPTPAASTQGTIAQLINDNDSSQSVSSNGPEARTTPQRGPSPTHSTSSSGNSTESGFLAWGGVGPNDVELKAVTSLSFNDSTLLRRQRSCSV